MTGAEIIALAHKHGVVAQVFFGKLRLHAEREPDESLVRLLRDNRQAVIDAFLKAETESDRWRRLLAEKIETVVKMRGLPRPNAEAEAPTIDFAGSFKYADRTLPAAPGPHTLAAQQLLERAMAEQLMA